MASHRDVPHAITAHLRPHPELILGGGNMGTDSVPTWEDRPGQRGGPKASL